MTPRKPLSDYRRIKRAQATAQTRRAEFKQQEWMITRMALWLKAADDYEREQKKKTK